MRLDARKGDFGYYVWHADECRPGRAVVWVDDETNQWAEHAVPLRIHLDFDGNLLLTTYAAKRIAIYLDRRLVIINPVADDVPEHLADVIAVTQITDPV